MRERRIKNYKEIDLSLKSRFLFFGTALISLSLIFIISCRENKNNKTVTMNPPSKLMETLNNAICIKIYIDESGKIKADNEVVSLDKLDRKLCELKDKKGTVWYSRAAPNHEPSKEAMAVLQMVIKHEIPIRLYTDSTFTQIIRG